MKTLIFLVSLISITFVCTAQNIVVEGVLPNAYVSHTVVAKENFYSVGRLYNQSPKAIAAFNSVAMEKGLSIGQHIKVPLNNQNFDGAEKATNGEVLIPVKHIVANGENIFKIATAFNTTAIAMREWNLLSSDNVSAGTALIVGHLKIKSGESTLAAGKNVIISPVVPKPVSPAAPKPVVNQPVKEEAVVVAATTPPPTPKKNDGGFANIQENKTGEMTTVIHEPVKKTAPEDSPNVPGKVIEPAGSGVIIPVSKPVQPTVPAKTEKRNIDLSTTPASSAEGAFASIFSNNIPNKSLNTKNGEAATFKTNSGWQDRKYYVLMNDVTPGTILRISSGNSKVVYAKVLGSIPEMKENNGLLLRISNSAASYLGIVDARFPIEVSFYQ